MPAAARRTALLALATGVVVAAVSWLILHRPASPCVPTAGAGNTSGGDCGDAMNLRGGSMRGNRDGTPGTRVR